MKVEFNNCSIQNQSFLENNNYINDKSFDILRETINNCCNDKEKNTIEPIIKDLEMEKRTGTLKKTDGDKWLNRVKDVFAIGGSAVAIANAPWWGTVSQAIQNIFTNLP